MKIEICQTNISFENKAVNLKKAEEIIANSKSDIIFFPEMSFTGFSMNTQLIGENNNYTVDFIANLAIKYNKAIGFGWVYKDTDKGENHYTFIDNKGLEWSDYVKIHPFSYSGEDKYYKGGDKIIVYKYNDFKFCNFICYDLRFPEIFQTASKTADVITVAANWPESRREHWITLLKARAIENMCYIIAINCVGEINGLKYSGDSCVINPNGEIIEMISNKEGNIVVNLENDVDSYRKAFPTKQDRRENIYKY